MDKTLRQELLDGFDRMTEMLEDLRSTTVRKEPLKPEPQAGDVWETDGGLFIYIHEERGKETLSYTFRDGGRVQNAKDRLGIGDVTRIFSLSEYLKEAKDV